MNKRLETLLDRASNWPEKDQAELLELAMEMEIESRQTGAYRLNDDERAAINKGLDAADRGELVSDEDMAAFFKRHGV